MEAAILEAALRVLGRVGYGALSIDAIVREASVGKPTLYRRWASKADLVTAALAHHIEVEPPPEPKGPPRGKLVAVLANLRRRLLEPNSLALVGTVLAEENRTPELIALFRERVWRRRAESLRSVLEEARASAKVRRGVDLDAVVDLLIGSMYGVYLAEGSIPATWPERTVRTVWNGIRRPRD